MKKNKIIIILGVFILITFMICNFEKVNMYDKKINYNSTKDIIKVLNNKVLAFYDEKHLYERKLTKDYQECLSKRKRLVGDDLNYEKLDLKIYDKLNNDESYKKEIIDCYKNYANNLIEYNVPNNIEVVTLIGQGISLANNEEIREDIVLDIVFIDEGEGLVIDGFFIKKIIDETGEEKFNHDIC